MNKEKRPLGQSPIFKDYYVNPTFLELKSVKIEYKIESIINEIHYVVKDFRGHLKSNDTLPILIDESDSRCLNFYITENTQLWDTIELMICLKEDE